jgi:hypothetical protein
MGTSWITPNESYPTGAGWGNADANAINNNLDYIRNQNSIFNGIKTFTGVVESNNSFIVVRDGSDEPGGGAYLKLGDNLDAFKAIIQLSADGHIDTKVFNGVSFGQNIRTTRSGRTLFGTTVESNAKVSIKSTGALNVLDVEGSTSTGIKLLSGTTARGYFSWDDTDQRLLIGQGSSTETMFIKNGQFLFGKNDTSTPEIMQVQGDILSAFSCSIRRDGSLAPGGGAYFKLGSEDDTKKSLLQLSPTGDLDTHMFNGTTWAITNRIDKDGNNYFLGSINLTTTPTESTNTISLNEEVYVLPRGFYDLKATLTRTGGTGGAAAAMQVQRFIDGSWEDLLSIGLTDGAQPPYIYISGGSVSSTGSNFRIKYTQTGNASGNIVIVESKT